jgi:ActR/RegA family two-component response regulator
MNKLLIVENDSADRDAIAQKAWAVGFPKDSLVFAWTEEQAYDLIRQESFQLAVVDICLSEPPKPDEQAEGYRVISRLHQQQPDCRIIAKTRQLGIAFARKAMSCGAHDVISSRWDYLDWKALLQQRLDLWKRVLDPEPVT